MKKKLLALCLASTLILSACENSSTSAVASTESTASSETKAVSEKAIEETKPAVAKDAIKIEDLSWEITTQINDYGEREIVANYTNNSPYPIVEFDLKMTQKADVTNEDRAVLSDLKDKYDYTDEDLQKLYMQAFIECYTNPGETSKGRYISLDIYAMRVPTSIEQTELMEPDIATITYIGSDDTVHVEYYDFVGKSYSLGNNSITTLYQPPTSDLANSFIDVDTPLLVASTDDSDSYWAKCYDIDSDGFAKCVEAWKSGGYSNVTWDGISDFGATNDSGVEVYLNWFADSETMVIELTGPADTAETSD